MRYQIWIVGFSFAVFGAIGWLFLGYSPVYIALMIFGLVTVVLGLFSGK
ncbi:MAG TPA: hypothetical protein VF221_07250 [Chloroflexota bacterium]